MPKKTKKSSAGRMILIVVAALAIPAIPFAAIGWWLEPQIETWIASSKMSDNPTWAVTAIVSILASDILLPIPSSAVCTFSGKLLGGWGGTLASWIGLNGSVVFGYWLGNRFGRKMSHRISSPEAMEEMEALVQRFGLWSVLFCRAVPIFAEASVLLFGTYRRSSPLFWITTFAANFGIAAAYAYMGKFAAENGWFSLAMAISISLPIALFLIWFRKSRQPTDSTQSPRSQD